ncbi:hypothetical protein H920_15200 [Fukomys damarensis]|uniref:Uncharacterized protein n=1 Tax=Fukomys damarensis TaxID=885580 RepID=A0A091CZS8_FUKDA|nr:hypothetical protein H920_15200 [Fukomys damarensis]
MPGVSQEKLQQQVALTEPVWGHLATPPVTRVTNSTLYNPQAASLKPSGPRKVGVMAGARAQSWAWGRASSAIVVVAASAECPRPLSASCASSGGRAKCRLSFLRRRIAIGPFQSSPKQHMLVSSSCRVLQLLRGASFLRVVNAAAECHPTERPSRKNVRAGARPFHSPDLAPNYFWLFPKVKMTKEGKDFESDPDSEAARTAQVKTLLKVDSRAASKSGEKEQEFKVWKNDLRGLKGTCLSL